MATTETPSPIPLPPQADARVLADKRRRSIYQYVCHSHGSVTVNEVAEAFTIHRNAAKHHLDRLLDAGMLRAEFRRVNGRRGPGAGRPSKLYSPTDVEVSFSVPERHYDLLAHLLLQALTQGADLETVGARFGRQLAETTISDGGAHEPSEGIRVVLDRLGFRPNVEIDVDGAMWITTENCPFGWVAMEAPEGEVCRLDRAIISGVLDGFGWASARVKGHTSIAGGQDVCVREVVPKRRRRDGAKRPPRTGMGV
ncbi:MAG: helix-turn-helix transcriptional regulator [Actinomycetota bacterium]